MGMATGNVAGPLSDSLSSSSLSRPTGQGAGGGDTLTPWPTARVPLIEDYRVDMVQRALFQGLASMGLPALTIHTVVRYSGRALKGAKSTFMRTWAPIGVCFPLFSYQSDPPYAPVSIQVINWAPSSVSLSFHSCLTSSTTRSRKQLTGRSALDYAFTEAKTPSGSYHGIQKFQGQERIEITRILRL